MKAPESKIDDIIKCAKAQEDATSEFLLLFNNGKNVEVAVGEEMVKVGMERVVISSSNTVGIFSRIISFVPFLRRG